jgi:sugar/nucleoside kinase (ribokinase family)
VHAASPEDAAQRLRALGVPTVCITLGATGVVAAQGDSVLQAAGFRVPVVDTTGAGDCFGAGFVYGLLQGWPLEQTVPFANAVAALKVMHRGGHSGSPRLDAVRAFLAQHAVPPITAT